MATTATAPMKKFLNDPAELVRESLAGLAAAHGDVLLVDDDVAVQDSLYTAGRRGVGATVLLEKIAGASAERGDDLAKVSAIARQVNDRARSFGVALSSCTPPAAGKPIFDLPDGEVEL